MCVQICLNQFLEMLCMFGYPCKSNLRRIFLFVSKVGFRACNPPVFHPAWKSLFVKIKIVSIARIAPLSAPHLEASLGVSCKDSNRHFVFCLLSGKGLYCSENLAQRLRRASNLSRYTPIALPPFNR